MQAFRRRSGRSIDHSAPIPKEWQQKTLRRGRITVEHRSMTRPKIEQAYRAQVAALPTRTMAAGVEVLLITSRETRRWIIPKGWPVKGVKDHQVAAHEAFEEAGVKGRVHRKPTGAYTYQKRFADHVEPCRVMVYRLDVEKQLSSWRERAQRRRQWFTVAEAADHVSEPALASMILGIGRNVKASS